jgi:hypothetical protein
VLPRARALKEFGMKLANRYGLFAIAVVILAMGAAIFSTGIAAQEEGWQIVRADYGYKNQRNDVTNILNDLVGRGGVNGKVTVNNQTMGGDPAIGKDKSLRIFAKNRKNEEREFNYNEGASVEARMFSVHRDDWDDRPTNYGGHDRDEGNSLKIIRAYYGVQGRTENVTDLLRSRIRDGVLSFVVTNSAMGGDPVIGAEKILIVVYRFQGRESATAVREGNTLTLP